MNETEPLICPHCRSEIAPESHGLECPHCGEPLDAIVPLPDEDRPTLFDDPDEVFLIVDDSTP